MSSTDEEFEDLNASRAFYAALARQPSPACDGDDARAVARRGGLVHSDDRLVGGARRDLDFEAARIRADSGRRLAIVEQYKREQREREERHRRFALAQPVERGLADPGVRVGNPGDWNQLVQGAHEALASDARRDRQGHRPEVIGGVDPDSREEEQRQLGGSPTQL